jgi:hypothetical protein
MGWRGTCNDRAADCEEKARQARDPQVQALYRALAEQWRELALIADPNIPSADPSGRTQR